MEHGIEAELASERWLSKLAPSDARGLTDLAAMFSFPASVSEPLRQVANGRSNVRAFSLNAMPLQVARAVIRRAWLGRRLPPSLVFRDQSPPSPDAIRERLVQEVSKQLPCSPDEAGFLVERVSASALIILMLRPLPDPSYIEHLLKSLPGTLFLFLIGSEGENPYPKIVTELTIPAGADMEFFKRYKHVMQTSVPREADRPEASTPPTETSEKVPAVVICAASASAAMVTRIERALTAAGLPVWIDKSELSAGALWRRELNDAIRASRAMVLVWSQAAARSRWVSLEILTAFHLDRFIVPCIIDATPLPEFLQQTVHLDLRGNGDEGIQRLIRAATEAPARRNTPSPPAVQDADVTQAATRLIRLQNEILDLVAERDPAAAAVAQRRLDPEMAAAERRWPSALMIRMLAGYHRKNAYALKHWKAIEAGQTPNDKLLLDAERCFLDAALVDPQEVSVLSGLASILSFERELDAAAFFNERALEVSKLQPNVSSDAEQNRRLIERMRRQGVPRAPETQRSTQRPSVAQTSEAAPVPMRPSRTIKTVAKGSRKIAPKKK
jgi:hypothetical protein